MKKSRFTEKKIAFALKQADLGMKAKEVCRKLGISDATFYKWRHKYGPLVRLSYAGFVNSRQRTTSLKG